MQETMTKPIQDKQTAEWQTVRLGDLGKIITGKTPPTTDPENFNGPYPFITIPDLNDLPLIRKTERTISEKGLSGVRSNLLPPNAVMMSCIATIGKCGITTRPSITNQQINSIICNERVEPRFLYYNFKTLGAALEGAGGGGSVYTNVSKNRFADIEISLPSLSEQRSIASILGSLDDKIELNRQMNETLEQTAQALFKSWFVDFEPFGGEMPSDWREGVLSEVLQSIKQPAKPGEQPGLPYVPIDAIPMRSLALTDFRPNEEAQSSLLTFAKNDILIGAMRVYFHRVSIAPFDGITRTTCFILRPRNSAYFEYLLLLCNEDSTIDFAQSTSKGSTMPYAVWDGGLANLRIAIPPQDVARKFSDMLRPIIERLRDSLFEIRTLNSLRDALLPKLLTGEIRAIDV